MSYWYLQRKGVHFSVLWLGYGQYPASYNLAHVTASLNEASSIYFVNLVIMQFFNLMATRTRRLSVFQQPPIGNKRTQNLYLFPAMVFALVVVFIMLYIPGLVSIFFPSFLGLDLLGFEAD